MKYIKPYNELLSKSIGDLVDDLILLCKKYNIKNYTINEDVSIDVNGVVYLHNREFSELPITFNKVSSHFFCQYNSLTSLKGAPKIVGGDFTCTHNKLTSLEGAPKEVGGDFRCGGNELTSLEGSPKKVSGYFYCNDNELTSLEGSPKIIGGDFNCEANNLTSVRGFPEDYEGNLLIRRGNPIWEIFEWFSLDVQNYKIAHLLNEYDVISIDGKKIYRDSLEEVFNVLGKEIPKDLKLENYEIH